MSLSAKRFSEIGIFCYACCISVFGFVVSHFFPLGNSKKITTRVQSWPKMANTNCVSRLLNWKHSQTDQKKHGLVNEISDTAPRKALTIGLWTLVRMVIHCGETGVRISHRAMDDRMKSCISFACALKGLWTGNKIDVGPVIYWRRPKKSYVCEHNPAQAAVLVKFLVLSTLCAIYANQPAWMCVQCGHVQSPARGLW